MFQVYEINTNKSRRDTQCFSMFFCELIYHVLKYIASQKLISICLIDAFMLFAVKKRVYGSPSVGKRARNRWIFVRAGYIFAVNRVCISAFVHTRTRTHRHTHTHTYVYYQHVWTNFYLIFGSVVIWDLVTLLINEFTFVSLFVRRLRNKNDSIAWHI